MADMKVVMPDDMGKGLSFNPTTQKFEAISQVAFTEREAVVDLMINGIQLLFREIANSNRTMVATGVRYNNVWYGDSPDDTPATNPFSGQPVTVLQPLTNDSFATKSDLDEFAKKADLMPYVQKGKNGTWGDTIAVSTNLYNPTRLGYYEPSTQNRPPSSSYGAVISFGSKGHLRKESQNWVYTLAFGTDQKIFLAQSINGGQDNWIAIPTSSVPLHTIKATGTTPAVGSSVTIPVSGIGNRDRIASASPRVDLANGAICPNCPIEIVADSSNRVTGVKFTNLAEYNTPQGRPLIVFITFER